MSTQGECYPIFLEVSLQSVTRACDDNLSFLDMAHMRCSACDAISRKIRCALCGSISMSYQLLVPMWRSPWKLYDLLKDLNLSISKSMRARCSSEDNRCSSSDGTKRWPKWSSPTIYEYHHKSSNDLTSSKSLSILKRIPFHT
jgi:hypothetical protein